MPAGILRDRVSLQQRNPNATPNSYNEQPDEWVDLLTNIPAQIYALSGREFTAAQQVQASITHRIVIRAPAQLSIRPENRFVWVELLLSGDEVTHYLDIKQAVPQVKRRGYVECLCVEHL